MTAIEPHRFRSSRVSDWHGRAFCADCPLPRRNAVHDVPDPDPDALADDYATRAAGDRDDLPAQRRSNPHEVRPGGEQ